MTEAREPHRASSFARPEKARDCTALLGVDDMPLLRATYGDEGVAAIEAELARRLAPHARPVEEAGGLFLTTGGAGDARLKFLRRLASSEPVRTPSGPALVTLSAVRSTGDATLETLAAALPGALANGPESTREANGSGLSSEREAVDALRDGSIELAFQPIMRADAAMFPAFHEALARLRGPNGDVLPAGRFLPPLEALGLTRIVDRQVLSLALARLRESPGLRLSANVSAKTLTDPVWMETLADAALETPDAPRRLIVEVTESAAAASPEVAVAFARQVRRAGCALAIDDFGAGSTALAQIPALRPDIVKVDGALVRGARSDTFKRAALSGIARICTELEVMTVAEWVETEEDTRFLEGLGYDALQGARYGMPSPNLVTAAPMSPAALSA